MKIIITNQATIVCSNIQSITVAHKYEEGTLRRTIIANMANRNDNYNLFTTLDSVKCRQVMDNINKFLSSEETAGYLDLKVSD